MKMGESGIAPVAVLAIILVSTGTAVATPVIVDTIDVDPDSPFYGLERLGEQIKMVSNEAQMVERWTEYERVVERGKGLEYRGVMQEFVDRLQALERENWESKMELVAWMQEQMPGIGLVRAMVMEQVCERLKEKIGDNLQEREEIDDIIREMAEIRDRIRVRYAEENEEIRARVQLRLEALRQIANRIMEKTGENLQEMLEIIDNLREAELRVEAKVRQTIEARIEARVEEIRENLENRITELQAMLQGMPENALSENAIREQVKLAQSGIQRAIEAHQQGKSGEAFRQVAVAMARIRIAERLAEKAPEWEPELSTQLARWRQGWEKIKENMVQEGTWTSFIQNPQQFMERIREKWTEKWQGTSP